MHRPPMAPRRLLSLAGVLAATATAFVASGCGNAADEASTATPAAVAPTTFTDTTPTSTSTTPPTSGASTASPDATPKASDPGSDSADAGSASASDVPAHAKPQAPTSPSTLDQLKPASKDDKLTVSSPAGTEPQWRVAAAVQGDNVLCVTVTTVGASGAAPDCQSGAQLGAQLLTSMGSGQGMATVSGIQDTVRSAPGGILVSGAVTADVSAVDVVYRDKTLHADLTKHTASVKVSRPEIKLMAAAEASKVPKSVAVKVFGVTIPNDAANPPTTAELEKKHPKGGVLTFRLQ